MGQCPFIGELTVQQFATTQHHVWRLEGKQYNICYLAATVKHLPILMVWGAMTAKETARLYFLPHSMTMNGYRYLNVLKEKLKLLMNIHQCDTFMHNGTPCHRSKLVSSFLQENQVKVLDCPGNSPHVHAIENLWKLMKDRVADKHPSLKSLKNAIKFV